MTKNCNNFLSLNYGCESSFGFSLENILGTLSVTLVMATNYRDISTQLVSKPVSACLILPHFALFNFSFDVHSIPIFCMCRKSKGGCKIPLHFPLH